MESTKTAETAERTTTERKKVDIVEIIKRHTEVKVDEWPTLHLYHDLDFKFQILKDCALETGQPVPNAQLLQLQTAQDVVDYYQQSRRTPTNLAVAQWFLDKKQEWPQNFSFIPFNKKAKLQIKQTFLSYPRRMFL